MSGWMSYKPERVEEYEEEMTKADGESYSPSNTTLPEYLLLDLNRLLPERRYWECSPPAPFRIAGWEYPPFPSISS